MSNVLRPQATAYLPAAVRTTARIVGAIGVAMTIAALAGLPYGVWVLPIGLGLMGLGGAIDLLAIAERNAGGILRWFNTLEPATAMRWLQGIGLALSFGVLIIGLVLNDEILIVAGMVGLFALGSGIVTTEVVHRTQYKTCRVDAGKRQAIIQLVGDALDDDAASELTVFAMHILRHNKAPRWHVAPTVTTSVAGAATPATPAVEPTPAAEELVLQEPAKVSQPTEEIPAVGGTPAVAGKSEVDATSSEQPTHAVDGRPVCAQCMQPADELFPTDRPGYGIQNLCIDCSAGYDGTIENLETLPPIETTVRQRGKHAAKRATTEPST